MAYPPFEDIVVPENITAKYAQRGAMGVSGSRQRVIPIRSERVHYVDDGLIMAEIGSTCVAIWRVRPNDFLFDRQSAAFLAAVESHVEPIAFLCILEQKIPAPSPEIRKASVEMLASAGHRLACVACVIADKGFTSAITRSVLSGMALMFGSRGFPIRFTDTVEHAVVWMTNYVELGSPDAYTSRVDTYRALLVRP
jgi:hypothetical protein